MPYCVFIFLIIEMNGKPLRNGKGVNKPFRSPFANIKRELKCDTKESSTSKQLSFEEASPSKQLKLSQTTIDESSTANNDTPSIQDLEDLKKRIQEKEKKVSDLKRSLLLRRKHNPEELKEDINKWTLVCQEALKDYQEEIQTKSSETVNMTQILSHLGIPDYIVRYSKEDDTFN